MHRGGWSYLGADMVSDKAPSLRRMWTMYTRFSVADGSHGKRDLLIAQPAFYAGTRGILRVFAHLIERGDYDELHSVVEAHQRLLARMQQQHARIRRH
jgi:hypothetical protein